MFLGNVIDFVFVYLDLVVDFKDFEVNKGEMEYVEYVFVKNEEGDFGFVISEDNSKFCKGLRRFLWCNFFVEFFWEVVEVNEYEFDFVEVKKVSFWVIFLLICIWYWLGWEKVFLVFCFCFCCWLCFLLYR